MESWQTTTDLSTLTTKQLRRRERIEAEDRMCRELGLTGLNAPRTSESLAIKALVNESSSIFDLCLAVDGLDQDSSYDFAKFSHADAALPRIGSKRLQAAQEYLATGSPAVPDPSVRRVARKIGEAEMALDIATGPRSAWRILRDMLIDRLTSLGVRMSDPSVSRCCRSIISDIRDYRTYSQFAHLSNQAEEKRADLEKYHGIKV